MIKLDEFDEESVCPGLFSGDFVQVILLGWVISQSLLPRPIIIDMTLTPLILYEMFRKVKVVEHDSLTSSEDDLWIARIFE